MTTYDGDPVVWPGHPDEFAEQLAQLQERLAAGEDLKSVVRGLARIATSYELALDQAVGEFIRRCAAGETEHVVEQARHLVDVDDASRRCKRAVGQLQSSYDRGVDTEVAAAGTQTIAALRQLVATAAAR
ncbi:MAG TPA: hypothetical protein PKB03_00065 [Baekduia sp.]|nr:hypothetical protein [Baekduia sp.]